nr:TIGR03862 family flavoprotein [Magnetospirillum molischianum]
METKAEPADAVVIGGGPAGLMAAETLAAQGFSVALYDAMPSPGRKFLLAGKGGLNLTHTEPMERFVERYGAQADRFGPLLAAFGPAELRAWAEELGIETFVGSSGRVFPAGMKAAPLLRAWLRRLKASGIALHVRHRWQGWDETGALAFSTPAGVIKVRASAVVLALGGASWPQLGSDGAWVGRLTERGLTVATLRPANCGFDLDWSPTFAERCAGTRLSTVELSFDGVVRRGELTLTATGIEGGLVYALAAPLRDAIERDGIALPTLDLMPDWSRERIEAALRRPRGSRSFSTFLRKALPLDANAVMVLREILPSTSLGDPVALAAAIKGGTLRLLRPRPLAEAISTAGGLSFDEVDEHLMLRRLPGQFVAGEMLDWEAPTGGYLLTGCFASGRVAGLGAADWLHALRKEAK